jgi:hypothetical protein
MIASLMLRSGQAEAQVLRGEVDALREVPEGRRLLLADSDQLIAHCREYPIQLRRHWDAFQKAAEGRVLHVENLGSFFAPLLSLAEAYHATITAVRQGLQEAEQSRSELEAETGAPLPAADLAALDAAAADIHAFRSEVAGRWDWLKSSPPAGRTLRTTAEIREGIARGEYLSVEDAFARSVGNPSEAS